jgi:hypothetical protein
MAMANHDSAVNAPAKGAHPEAVGQIWRRSRMSSQGPDEPKQCRSLAGKYLSLPLEAAASISRVQARTFTCNRRPIAENGLGIAPHNKAPIRNITASQELDLANTSIKSTA